MLSTIKRVAGSSHPYTPDEMMKLGFVQGMRYNKGRYYSITPLSDGRYLLVLFKIWKDEIIHPELENIFMIVTDFYFVSELCDRKTFDETIKIGVPMEEILVMDPDSHAWERTLENVTDYHSRHRFNDKSFVYVNYTIDSETQQPVVADFHELSTEDFVLTYLLPWDLELITK